MTPSTRCQLGVAAVLAVVICASARTAAAQEALIRGTISEQTYDASALTALEGHGYELTHGVILHPLARLEGGATSNVFYTPPDAAPIASGLARLSGALYVSNDKPRPEDPDDAGDTDDPTPLDYQFRGGMQFSYLEFLSGDQVVRNQRQFNVAGDINLVIKPTGPWSLIVQDQYRRDTSSVTYEDASTLTRDDDHLFVGGRFTSEGGIASFTAHYENQLQYFENIESVSLPSRLDHTIGAGGQYNLDGDQHTALLVDASYGFFRTLGSTNAVGFYKSNSQPLRVVVGVVRELSSTITGHAEMGFARASYGARSDGRIEGYDAPVALAELALRWTSTGRMLARYRYDHFDSSLSNYYRDHALELKLVQQYRFLVFDGGPELYFREYSGMPLPGADRRDDTIVAVRARVQAVVAERYSISLDYRLSRVSTDYAETVVDAAGNRGSTPSYTRHDVLAGLTVAY
jgi:hypothetical protein